MSTNGDKTDGLCILSLDNGGPGAYSQLLIMKEYMSRVASDLQVVEDDVYPADHFDLMGGVGFGGLVALMLGTLRMSVNEAIDALLDITAAIFPDNPEDAIDLDINAKNLKDAIENMLEARNIVLETKMDETRASAGCKVALYAAASSNLNHPRVFRTYPVRGSALNPTIVDAACATMSIPSHFSPTKIGPPRRQQLFVGAVLGANNPTRLLLDEARTVFGNDRRVAQILSLGCGLPRVLSPELLKRVAQELSARLFNVDAYLRLSVDRGMEEVVMDWNNLGSIESHTAAYIDKTGVSEALDSSLQHIKERIATVTLGQLNSSSSIKAIAKKAPPVSPHFVPRKKPWEMMVNHLITSPSLRQTILPITGMGGCGKTQLISYFFQEYPDLYERVAYVDASSSFSIKTDLQTWVRAFGDGHERDSWEDALRLLNNPPQSARWALVLDNADDPVLNLSPFLPTSLNISVIITSRNRDLGNLSTACHLELGEMSFDESLATILNAARRQLPLSDVETQSALILLKELGYLAVALVQAGTYCYRLSSSVNDVLQPYTFTQYLALFYTHRAELMKKAEPASLDNYERGAYTTLDLSYKILPQAPRDFLHLISVFHHTDIPLEALATAAKNQFSDPFIYLPRPETQNDTIVELRHVLCGDTEWNELWVQELIYTLRSFSLLAATSIDDSIFLSLHPLIQIWCRDMDPVASKRYNAMVIQVLTASSNDPDFKLKRRILPQMLDILSRTSLHDLHVNDLMAFGAALRHQGHYQRAESLYETALEIMKSVPNSDTESTLTVISWLGETYIQQGKWKEAEELLVNLLQQDMNALGKAHPNVFTTLASLAEVYSAQGRLSKAEELQVEVLEQRIRTMGIDHPKTGIAAGRLAQTYKRQERLAEAEGLEVKVLEQRRRILGIDHPHTHLAAENLSETYRAQGRWSEAEKLAVEAVENHKQVLGTEHPYTITAISHLSIIYASQSRWEEAAALLIPAVQLSLKALGRQHRDTRTAVQSLIFVYKKLEKHKEVEEMNKLLL